MEGERGGGEISAELPILCVKDAGKEKGYVTLARGLRVHPSMMSHAPPWRRSFSVAVAIEFHLEFAVGFSWVLQVQMNIHGFWPLASYERWIGCRP
jgi:hypothetical protein